MPNRKYISSYSTAYCLLSQTYFKKHTMPSAKTMTMTERKEKVAALIKQLEENDISFIKAIVELYYRNLKLP